MGLTGLSPIEQARLAVGNATFKFTCKVIRLAIKWKVAAYLENPAGSLMWHAPELARLLRAASAQKVQLHMCQFGAPWRKATTVAAWFSLPLLNLGLCCSGRSGICSKTKKTSCDTIRSRSSWSSFYPPGCRVSQSLRSEV